MLSQHKINAQEHQEWFARTSADPSRCLLMVEEGSKPLGYVQFTDVDRGGIADWGFYVKPNAAPGSGKKLGVTALNYGFEILQLHKVCGKVIASNHASIRFHERLGFTKEGELREQQLIDGLFNNLICFGLLSSEWGLINVL
jgi:UDP-4-amino-4,6-dideoxy-N-acetyl-beta-L-altrosamine N-acetyltransferase